MIGTVQTDSVGFVIKLIGFTLRQVKAFISVGVIVLSVMAFGDTFALISVLVHPVVPTAHIAEGLPVVVFIVNAALTIGWTGFATGELLLRSKDHWNRHPIVICKHNVQVVESLPIKSQWTGDHTVPKLVAFNKSELAYWGVASHTFHTLVHVETLLATCWTTLADIFAVHKVTLITLQGGLI